MRKINILVLVISIVILLLLSGCNNISNASSNKENNSDSDKLNSNSKNLPPDEAIAACKSKKIGDSCQFESKDGTLTGVCNDKPGVLACAPSKDGNKNEGQSSTIKSEVQNNSTKNTNSQNSGSQNTNSQSDLSNLNFGSCINSTKDNPQCKDCCDCLSGVSSDIRTKCRDTCAVYDFSKNTNYITITTPSVLGANGDYSKCTAKASSGECKICCEGSAQEGALGLECGDYRHCRTACNNKFGNSTESSNTPSTNPVTNNTASSNYYDASKSEYNIEQAISDRAQETTIAYDALAFFTGNTCADSFIPPGKVADFFGYQYLRDNTPNGMGHNTDFVTNSANNVLYILNDAQKEKLYAIAKLQIISINQYAYDRYPLLVAFRRQLEGDIPSGTTGLSKDAVVSYSEDLYTIDAQISIQRAKLFGDIIRSLDANQKAALDAMVEGGFDSLTPRENDLNKEDLSRDENVLVMTFASEMFGWYAGSVVADTYFCPERHGTYFGSFYMKDAPAMGNPGYTIDETITGNKGETMLTMLTESQSKLITDIVDLQKDNLNGIVDTREAMSAELRKFLIQDTIDEDKVYTLAKQYGAYDGENVYYYATNFAKVMDTLTDAQKADLMELRNLEDYPCPDTNIYVYSERVTKPSIKNTDFLFE